MKLTDGQYKLLREVADSNSRGGHEVRQVAVGFSGYKTTRGFREATIDAMRDAGYITTENVRGSDTHRGFTRFGHTTYATLTPAGRAALKAHVARR